MRRPESGSYVIEAVIGICLVMTVLVAFGGVVAYTYVRSVAHSAVDQGVRAGSRVDVDPVPVCEDRIRSVLGDLMANTGANVSCASDSEVVTGRVALDVHMPMLATASVMVRGLARIEKAPE